MNSEGLREFRKRRFEIIETTESKVKSSLTRQKANTQTRKERHLKKHVGLM